MKMMKEERILRKHIRTCPETMYKGMGKCMATGSKRG